jgi:DNA primase
LLASDRTLRLATLPAGEDPDTLVARQGVASFNTVLAAARPLEQALYDLLREACGQATPEQRAAFRSRLDQAARRIPDKALSDEYRDTLLGLFYADRRRGRAAQFATSTGNAIAMPRVARRPLPSADGTDYERARILTAILLHHPALLRDVDYAYAGIPLQTSLAALRNAIRRWADRADRLHSTALIDHLRSSGLNGDVDQILARAPVPLPACAAPTATIADAEAGWWHIFGFLNLERLREEVKLAGSRAAANLTPDTQRRLKSLKDALNMVMAGEPDGATESRALSHP